MCSGFSGRLCVRTKYILLRGNLHLGGQFPPMKLPIYEGASDLPSGGVFGELVMVGRKMYWFAE